MNTDKPSEREEIEMLLPWYATGTLGEADRKRVEAYLAQHPEMRARLDLSHAEQSETAFLNEPVPTPSASTTERFMAQLGNRPSAEQRRARVPPQRAGNGLLAWMNDKLVEPLLNPSQLHWGAVAAALVILAQALAIVMLLSSEQPGTGAVYRTASGETQTVTAGTHVDVRFANDARAADIAAVLSELNMTIAGGPKAGGFYLVRIGPDGMTGTEIDRRIAALKLRTGIVLFVTGTR